MAKQNFKELNDGRYKLILPDDIVEIFLKAIIAYRKQPLIAVHEMMLADELFEAMQKEQIKLRKSEFFLLFSSQVQIHINESTQNYVNSWLNLDEAKRQMTAKNRRRLPHQEFHLLNSK